MIYVFPLPKTVTGSSAIGAKFPSATAAIQFHIFPSVFCITNLHAEVSFSLALTSLPSSPPAFGSVWCLVSASSLFCTVNLLQEPGLGHHLA